jgi:hypothetical protein
MVARAKAVAISEWRSICVLLDCCPDFLVPEKYFVFDNKDVISRGCACHIASSPSIALAVDDGSASEVE